MNIDKTVLDRCIWYEDIDGNVLDIDPMMVSPRDERIATRHVMFPLEVHETIYPYNPETGEDEGHFGFTTHIGGGNQDVILAMANSGDYTLAQAIMLWAKSCERCMNVFAYKYLNGADGYPEHSEEWKKCNTECQFCK